MAHCRCQVEGIWQGIKKGCFRQLLTKTALRPGYVQIKLIEPFVNAGDTLASTYTGSDHTITLVAPAHFIQYLDR